MKANKHRFYNRRKSDYVPMEKEKENKEENLNSKITFNKRGSAPNISSQIKEQQKFILKDDNPKMSQPEQNKNIENEKINEIINKKEILNSKNEINNNLDKNDEEKTKQNESNLLDDLINEVEKFNAKNILKGDLAKIYEEVIKENSDFKENIFFVNLNHYEKMVGTCDNRVILHSFKDMKKEELLKNKYLPSKDLYNKYRNKAKDIIENN